MSEEPREGLDQNALERGRATVRTISDTELSEMHAQGPSAFQAGAWEVLDAEIARRKRVKARQSVAPPLEADEEERYPALRITVVLVKVSAALVLIASVIIGLLYVGTNFVGALLVVVVGVLAAVSYWAGAELLLVLMDIEANTRFLRRGRP